MYKNFYTLIGIGVAGLFVYFAYSHWHEYSTGQRSYKLTNATRRTSNSQTNIVAQLGQLPSEMESELAIAQRQGAEGLKKFLENYKCSSTLRDPRKAWIQLDYVVAIALRDLPEARRVFSIVKCRVKSDSPVYERVKQLQHVLE